MPLYREKYDNSSVPKNLSVFQQNSPLRVLAATVSRHPFDFIRRVFLVVGARCHGYRVTYSPLDVNVNTRHAPRVV